ncbi:alginate export family protein, partial [Myxococcota bacterium]|nr:alginate export family protein [Myxococcota bacterium]
PHDHVALFRAMTHVDLRIADRLRLFAQLGSFAEAGRAGERAPTDLDRVDLLQAFVDVDFEAGRGDLTFRGGRQELSLGSSRLVGVREGANERRTFVGARGIWMAGDARVDALWARPMTVEPGAFDNGVNDDEAIWGVYGSGRVAGPLVLDLYYLGAERDDAAYAEGVGDERRHSLGLRLSGASSGFDWDVEAVGQVGKVGALDVRAWTLASDFGYAFAKIPLAPRLGLKADVASGDRRSGDGTLGTFNALYPRFPYFSEAILVVPANIIDFNVSLRLHPASSLRLELGWNPVWRYDTSDAVYAAPLSPIAGTANQPGRFTAHQTIVGFVWTPIRSIEVAGQYVHAVPANALREVGGDEVDFGTVSLGFKY